MLWSCRNKAWKQKKSASKYERREVLKLIMGFTKGNMKWK